jgi:cellulose synthase/poly-beta-1,6-N-acetylglucosamine synthase-like glycosyltransferase
MLSFVAFLVAVISGLLTIPILVLFIEVVAALNWTNHDPFKGRSRAVRKQAVVVIPAHNESSGILPTISDIKPQLSEGDRLVVVADNCSDDTAAVAAGAGAEVLIRNNPKQTGKGYALDWAIRHLSSHPPDFVIFIDADCRIEIEMIVRLKDVCDELDRPVQACFLMTRPESSALNFSLAEFAWTIRNWVRPLGLRYLNGPCQLMGTGMIFPWQVIRTAPLATGNLVEDLNLGLDLALAGKAPYFFPFVIGISHFPMTRKAADSQRQRWVRGHLAMIVRKLPRMLCLALARGNVNLLVLVLDQTVPPLSLLAVLVAGTLVVTALIAFFGLSPAGLVISTVNLLVFGLSLAFAWLKFGRNILPPSSLTSLLPSVFGTFRIYGKILMGKTTRQWVRTDRSPKTIHLNGDGDRKESA